MTSGSALDDFGDGFVELLNVELAVVVVVVKLDYRCLIANTETPIDYLNREFAIGGGFTIGDPVAIPQFVNEILASTDKAGCSVAEQHEMVAWLVGSEVSIKGKQPVNAVLGNAKVFGNHPGGPERDPTQQVLHVLERSKNLFLGFFVVAWVIRRIKQSLDTCGIGLVDLHLLNQRLDSPSASVTRFGRTRRSTACERSHELLQRV